MTPITLDLRRGYATSYPPNQVNDSKKGSNGPAGSRSGKLHSEGLREGWARPAGLGLKSVDTPRFSIGPAGPSGLTYLLRRSSHKTELLYKDLAKSRKLETP